MALERGDHAQAFEYAKRASEAAPNDPQLWFLLGYAARLDGKNQQSVDAYNHGLRLSPSALDGISGLAQTYSVMGKSEDAERLLKQALAADPRRANDGLVLGDLYMRAADYTSALDALNHAERVHPDARSELLIGICYEHLKQIDMASRYFELARKHAPDNPEVQRSMAGYFREVGKYPEAITALKSIRNPKPDVMAELALYLPARRQARAIPPGCTPRRRTRSPKTLPCSSPPPRPRSATGSIDQANPFLQRAAEIDPNYYRLHAIRGEIARQREQVGEAIKEYNIALTSLPAEPPEGPLYGIQLHMDLLELYTADRNPGAAAEQLKTAQEQIGRLNEQGPGRAPFLRLRALIRMHARQPRRSAERRKGCARHECH